MKLTFIKEATIQTTGLPPTTAETPIMEFKISINKTSPATPGDKHLSTVINLDRPIPNGYRLWNQGCPLELESNIIVYEQKEIEEKLSNWDEEEPVTMIKCLYDIVSYANSVEPPLWHVKTKISSDGIPFMSDQKKSTNIIRTRIDAFLSFDSESYTMLAYNKWPEKIKKETQQQVEKEKETTTEGITTQTTGLPRATKGECIKYIYRLISQNEGDRINTLMKNRVISHSAKRLTLDNIGEGEWRLPIHVWDGQKEDTKRLLGYVKVKIDWTSEKAKITDETSQQASKTTDADKKSPSPET